MSLQLPDALNSDMPALLAYLEVGFYKPISEQCRQAATYTVPLNKEPAPYVLQTYTGLCNQLFEQIYIYEQQRQVVLLPYITELAEKQDTGHDCRSCSASCTIRHTARIAGIRETHKKVKAILEQLQQTTLAAYRQSSFQEDQLPVLYSEMQALSYRLIRLFHLEESMLIPMLIEAQKNIYAHD